MSGLRLHNRQSEGFSLVELMIVVGIIGILATLAVPRFQSFQAKARMGEVKTMLSHIYTLEESYYLDRDVYIDFTTYGKGNCTQPQGARDLGLQIVPCNQQLPRFAYTVTGANTTSFLIEGNTTANNTVCANTTPLFFRMDQNRTVTGSGPNNTAPTSCN